MSRETSIPAEQMLANFIVVKAAEDYRTSVRNLKINPKHKEALRMLKECETFFESQWYQMLTSVDGKMIMRKIREEELAQ